LTPPAAPSPAIEEEVSSASVALGPAAVALETAVVASEAAARPPDNSVDETPGSLLAEDFLLMATTPDLGYAQFLRRVGKDETSPRALRVSEGQPILGKPALKALATRRGRLFLLSALYSLYNRQRNEVTDQQEREFHSQLMRTALERS
jgi:hypothetical protein